MRIADCLRASVVLMAGVAAAEAQQPPLELRGYYLHLALAAEAGPFNLSGLTDVQRARLMLRRVRGPLAFDAAYEQTLAYSSSIGIVGLLGGLGQVRGGTEWLPLQGAIERSQHLEWRHRVDRMFVRYSTGHVEITAGRQPVSWATTLFLGPADPFTPFDPSDPFREYRAGVDALRVRAFPTGFVELDAVLRPADTPLPGATMTAALRAKLATGHWELAGWGGLVHDEPAASLAATVTVGGAVLRSEAVLRRSEDRTVGRLAVGADRSFRLWRRTLYVVAEYQRDGFGAARPVDLIRTMFGRPAIRGELQVFGRDVTAAQLTYQLHPLLSAEGLMLWDVGDGSMLFAPAAGYSARSNLTIRAGLFAGRGVAVLPGGTPGSEYGAVPTAGYVSVAAFF